MALKLKSSSRGNPIGSQISNGSLFSAMGTAVVPNPGLCSFHVFKPNGVKGSSCSGLVSDGGGSRLLIRRHVGHDSVPTVAMDVLAGLSLIGRLSAARRRECEKSDRD